MKNVLVGAAAVVALMAGATRPSEASLMISLADDNGHSVTVTDAAAAGVLTFVGSVGDFAINVTTGVSKPNIGSAIFPQIDLNSVNVTSQTGAKLTLEVTDTDFIGSGISTFLSQIGGAQGAGGTLGYRTFMDCGNTAFGMGTSLGNLSFSGTPFSGSQATTTALCGSPYSLTEQVLLSLPGGGLITSFNANLALPEPASLMLFGVGLVGIGLASRRKRLVQSAV